jgi:hypothetical protein
MNVQICKTCNGEIPIINSYPKTLDYHSCPKRQSAEFYAYGESQIVWEQDTNPFFVLVCGEMCIIAKDDNGKTHIIRTAEELIAFGVTNDEELEKWTNRTDDRFYYRLNPWFEVAHTLSDFYSDPLHELNEAISYAKEVDENPEDFGVTPLQEDEE